MSRLAEVGERDGWRCWLCDEAVDPQMSVNDARGPSIDSRTSKPAGKGTGKRNQPDGTDERLGQQAASWLVDRVSRLSPGLAVTAEVEPGGGQYLLVLRA